MFSGEFATSEPHVFEVEESVDLVILRAAENPLKPTYETRHREYNRLRREYAENEPRFILFDLTKSVILDSVMIGTMVALTHAARDRGRNAVIVGPSDEIVALLGRLMLLEPNNRRAMWATYDTLRDALVDYPW